MCKLSRRRPISAARRTHISFWADPGSALFEIWVLWRVKPTPLSAMVSLTRNILHFCTNFLPFLLDKKSRIRRSQRAKESRPTSRACLTWRTPLPHVGQGPRARPSVGLAFPVLVFFGGVSRLQKACHPRVGWCVGGDLCFLEPSFTYPFSLMRRKRRIIIHKPSATRQRQGIRWDFRYRTHPKQVSIQDGECWLDDQ